MIKYPIDNDTLNCLRKAFEIIKEKCTLQIKGSIRIDELRESIRDVITEYYYGILESKELYDSVDLNNCIDFLNDYKLFKQQKKIVSNEKPSTWLSRSYITDQNTVNNSFASKHQVSWSDTCLFFRLMEDFSFPKEFFLPIEEDYYLNHYLFDENEHIQVKWWKWNNELCCEPDPKGKSFTLQDETGISIEIIVKEVFESEEITLLEMLYGIEKMIRVEGRIISSYKSDYQEFELAIIGHQLAAINPDCLIIDYKLALLDLAVEGLINRFHRSFERGDKLRDKILKIKNFKSNDNKQ